MSGRRKFLIAAAAAAVLVLPAATLYYESPGGEGCARCHEIRATFDAWRMSSHRGVRCTACHGDALTLDAGFHWGNVRRLAAHLRGDTPEQIRIKNRDVAFLMERCRNCHQQEFSQWRSGPHSVTYAQIFLDEKHNRKRLLIDDCLRCHGMYFQGALRDLVTPVNTTGPWMLLKPELAEQPAIPCMGCHQMHREGKPLEKGARQMHLPGTGQEIARPSLAIFDRRGTAHVGAASLPMPAMRDGVRPVKMSPDMRQALCYQCHAPLATFQAGSGDDRTGLGVHEGLSCIACHQKHGQQTRASCATCHPRLSNCGLDVEKMDTTFASPNSRHNIHFVKCGDCHTKGVPKRKQQAGLTVD